MPGGYGRRGGGAVSARSCPCSCLGAEMLGFANGLSRRCGLGKAGRWSLLGLRSAGWHAPVLARGGFGGFGPPLWPVWGAVVVPGVVVSFQDFHYWWIGSKRPSRSFLIYPSPCEMYLSAPGVKYLRPPV